ncbi:MAG: pyruvate:ferredoxin (flavodoxin) oxidoreductase, partial [Clostridia bacterium]|nr:pyruvate:ferredoxin (flavodoxin) oxidoreductase [Clostridia bacterium]
MYKIAGELLPNVIHVSARAVASHALSIFGDHSDVMACRQTGYAMLCAGNPQEVMDLGAVAHLSTIKGRVPFLHFFDGFRTSHEIQKVACWDYKDLAEMVDMDAIKAFRERSLNPEHPVLKGSAQNPDIFFQAREACNSYYNALPAIVEDYMNQVNARIGTKYKLFNYYGAKDAETVIIAMGSVCDTAEETVDYLRAKGEKVGLLKVRLYRPFSIKHFLAALPKTVKNLCVLDRTKEPGSIGEPLYLDVCNAVRGTAFENCSITGGRYGLGSKDTTPACIIAAFRNAQAKKPKKIFTVGIDDDVTNLSLKIRENPETAPQGTVACKFWGLGADGTVGANKNSIKIIGDHTKLYAQAYFAYDSKKSGGLTVSHLRFGKKPIRSTYYVSKADFVVCHNPSYVGKYDLTSDLKKGGKFLLNCNWDLAEMEARFPAAMKRDLATKKIDFYTIDGVGIAKEIGMGGRINTILQAAFFKIANIIPTNDAIRYMKEAVVKSYGSKGEKIVNMNFAAIDRGAVSYKKVEVPAAWANAVDTPADVKVDCDRADLKEFVENIVMPVNAQKGDELPVSTFVKNADGLMPQGSAAFEKRGIAVDVPQWIPENCIQCNQCAYVCPHACLRPAVMTAEEAAESGAQTKKMMGKGLDALQYVMTVSVLDCTGCRNCVNTCPAKEKALVMKPLDTQLDKQSVFEYADKKVSEKPEVAAVFKPESVKGSQFRRPLLEFSGACPGCAEPTYARLATQLFGDRMYIANATGCSSIWGGSAPATPYTVNKKGQGPAWANSLFEDNAEYGYGMMLAVEQRRAHVAELVTKLAAESEGELKAACENWLAVMDEGEASKAASAALEAALEAAGTPACKELLGMKDMFVKKSVWILGGDGWAYDIGFGGLDHVLASGKDVNILVFDTEVYSNTGGQASKATPVGSVAHFAAAGKGVKKKDLAAIAMSYGYVYVAQIGMGADFNQCIKAFNEAESYHGPSLIIAYAPCINHGIKKLGMSDTQGVIKAAVAAGYWHLFRFDPRRADKGENPFVLDSKAPSASYRDFILNENRYSSLTLSFPDRAEKLFAQAETVATEKYEKLVKLAEQK